MTTLLEQAMTRHRGGAPEDAERLYRELLEAEPGNRRGREMLAMLLVGQDRFAEALDECDTVLAADPRAIEALMQKGFALQGLDRREEALAHYGQILAMNDRFTPAHYFQGKLLLALGRPQEALQSLDRALSGARPFAEAWLSRGVALERLGRLAEALASYDRILALQPEIPEAWFNRGAVLEKMSYLEDALQSYDRTLAFRPHYAAALNNRGTTLMGLRRFNEAMAAYDTLAAINPLHPYAFGGLAAAALYACDWDRVAKLRGEVERHVGEARTVVSPGALLGYDDDPALLRRCVTTFTKNQIPAPPPPLWQGERFRNEKIRVAYLSADFHEHATAHLIAELFERHDRQRFEIWGMGFDGDDGSAMRRRLIRSFDRFENVADKADAEAAALLHAGRVDIAVDLKGHTLNARTGIFAHRPAPIQVNYLGFPGTMGADFYDYILADRIVLPMEQQPFCSETIMHLPDCYQPNDATRTVSAPVPGRAAAGLPQDGFVFCCFNNNWKITAVLFDVWMRLLAAVPGSVLWLLEDNKDASTNLKREAQARGVAPERLIFAPRLDVEPHLARHALADLFLDTLPYNAHTTASDALRMGVPVLTLTGRAFAGRVATSLLHAVGLPELAVETLEDYQRLALALAREPARLGLLKQKLNANRSVTPLFDSTLFRRGIEAAYTAMWERWQSGS